MSDSDPNSLRGDTTRNRYKLIRTSKARILLQEVVSHIPARYRPKLRWTVRKLHALSHSSHGKVMLTSIPKAGTHFVSELLKVMEYRLFENQPFNPNVLLDYDPEPLYDIMQKVMSGEYVIEHLAWNGVAEKMLVDAGFKILFIYRDPRAAAVSFAHYVGGMNRNHRLHAYFQTFSTLDERVLATLDGVPNDRSSNGYGRAPLAAIYDSFKPWLHSDHVCCVKFEDIIGPQGGGSETAQVESIYKIANFLALNPNSAEVEEWAGSAYNRNSPTFRKASLHSWRDEISPSTLTELNDRLARQVFEWGYQL